MLRVNADMVEFGDDYVYRLNNLPFTGIAEERDEQGQLISELEFKDGMQHGITREWIDGVLRLEHSFRLGAKDGLQREWAADGSLESVEEYELGIRRARSISSSDGELEETFRLGEQDSQYQTLEALRRAIPD
jgi:antitoxin component YwqK of YwqJK toxin-antitoxin module